MERLSEMHEPILTTLLTYQPVDMPLRMGSLLLPLRWVRATGLEFDPALSTQAWPGLLLAQAPDTARACAGEGSVSVDPSDTDSADASLDNLANANSASHVAAVLRGEAPRMLEVYAGHQLLPVNAFGLRIDAFDGQRQATYFLPHSNAKWTG